MSRMRDYRPIEFRQACAIARVVFLRDPGMTTFEWKESVKDACVKQGYLTPEGDMLTRAISAVERALEQTMGPRQTREDVPPPVPPKPNGREWTAADYRALADTVKRISARSSGITAHRQNVTPFVAVERLDISEAAALDQFYIEVAAGDRLGALKRFAEVAIVRPEDWDFGAIRAGKVTVSGEDCFGCLRQARANNRHHVIQVQHGGSNYVRNIVNLCDDCHAAVHPWLPQIPRRERCGDWVTVGGVSASAFKLIDQMLRQNRDAS